MSNTEYLLTDDKEIWIVDYDNGIAKYKPHLKLNDLDFADCVDLEERTVMNYLESNGFGICMEESNNIRIVFRE